MRPIRRVIRIQGFILRSTSRSMENRQSEREYPGKGRVLYAENMFKKTYTMIDTKYYRPKRRLRGAEHSSGLWRKCNKCGQPIYVEDVKNNYYVCPKCDGYFRVHAYRRIEMTIDEGTFEEWNRRCLSPTPWISRDMRRRSCCQGKESSERSDRHRTRNHD